MRSNLPNILFIMTDELRADVLGYAGNTTVRTPNIDKLAEGSAIFQNAYTPSPICVPARQAMMAGQLPSHCGCKGWVDLKPGYMTIARWLSYHGYYTCACGKLHHFGEDMMQGFVRRIGCEMESREFEKYVFPDYQRHVRSAFAGKWSDRKEVLRAGIGKGKYGIEDAYTLLGTKNFINQYFADPYYDRSLEDMPLFLNVSFVQPHYPYIVESEDKFTYYLARVQQYSTQEVFDHPFLKLRQINVPEEASEREVRRAIAAYYAMIETVDDYVGEVTGTLEQVGQDLQNWVVVFASDHGEMLGEHGIWEKGKFFEGSVKVPLLIRFPGMEKTAWIHENVSLCDLFATFCELAGIDTPPDLDSRSLVPLCNGQTKDWDDTVISQIYGKGFEAGNIMIKQGALKYQYYGQDQSEVLFDLHKNPQETKDYSSDAEYGTVLGQMRNRLHQLLNENN